MDRSGQGRRKEEKDNSKREDRRRKIAIKCAL